MGGRARGRGTAPSTGGRMEVDRTLVDAVFDNPTQLVLIMAGRGRGRGTSPASSGRRDLSLVGIGAVSDDPTHQDSLVDVVVHGRGSIGGDVAATGGGRAPNIVASEVRETTVVVDRWIRGRGIDAVRSRGAVREAEVDGGGVSGGNLVEEDGDHSGSGGGAGNIENVWSHGVSLAGNSWYCNYCEWTGKAGGATRFVEHLGGTGGDCHACLSAPSNVVNIMRDVRMKAKEKKRRKKEANIRIQNELAELNRAALLTSHMENQGSNGAGCSSGVGSSGSVGGSISSGIKKYFHVELQEYMATFQHDWYQFGVPVMDWLSYSRSESERLLDVDDYEVDDEDSGDDIDDDDEDGGGNDDDGNGPQVRKSTRRRMKSCKLKDVNPYTTS